MGRAIDARSWRPQDLIDDLQALIDEEQDKYLNDRHTTLCMARDYLKEYFSLPQPSNEPLTLEEAKSEKFVWFEPLKEWAKVTPLGVLFIGSVELMDWETLRIDWGQLFNAYRRPPEGEDGDATRG